MTSIYGLAPTHWLVALLRAMERWSFAFADQIITVNLACRKIFSARSCAAEKIEVVMNSPNDAIFSFKPAEAPLVQRGRFVVMFHGSIVERHGLDLAVTAMRSLLARRPDAELRIYGKSNPYLQQVLVEAERLGISQNVRHLGALDQSGIASAIDACDVGIIPNRRSIFTEINTPTRIFEYLARGKPVIAPNSPGITDYFGPDELTYFELGDVADLSRQLIRAAENPDLMQRTAVRGQQVYLRHRWPRERERFVGVVASLMRPSRIALSAPVPARQ
jgi:glycosyltransferase involved in cell wall biosynthesis